MTGQAGAAGVAVVAAGAGANADPATSQPILVMSAVPRTLSSRRSTMISRILLPRATPAPPHKPDRGHAARAANDTDSEANHKAQRQPRIWDVPSAADAADDEPPAPPVAEIAKSPEPVTEAEADQPRPVRRRHEIGSSEPRIERVVVKPGANDGEPGVSDTEATPQRKGWWQRKFGGE